MPTPDDATWMRPLGRTGLTVSAVCLGAGPLGNTPDDVGQEAATARAVELVRTVLDSPVRTIDTSNGYGGGDSERRIGTALSAAGGLPADAVVITKVDPRDGDYSGARVRASVAESRERLGLDHLPLVHLHDPENHPFEAMTGPGGAVEALVALKEAGEVGSIGLAGGDVRVMARYLDLDVFDALLVHNRWTLVDRSAGSLIDSALAKGVGVVNAAVYGGGILARDRDEGPAEYGYRPAHPATLEAVAALRSLAAEHGTDVATLALQHSLRDERFATTIVGTTRAERVPALVASTRVELPESVWPAVERLLPPPEAWLDAGELDSPR